MTYQSIDVRKLTPRIGAEIFGVDLSTDLSNQQVDEIKSAFLENQVIFFRDQKLSVEQQKAFGRRFGQLHKVPNPRRPVNGDPEVIAIWADETSTSVSGDTWHSDTTSDPKPPLGSMLYMLETPANGGGDTMFASMYDAYDTLSDAMKSFLSGLTAIHDGARVYVGKGRPQPAGELPRTEHPVVRPHPETGRKVLFVNRLFTSHIVQLAPDESTALLEMLYQHAAKPEFQCRFKWQPGSVAFWDNRCAHHYAVWDYFPHRRFGHRITISDS